jgi:hypothetical protein
MYKASLPDRLRYAFDNTMSKGTIALIGLLAALSTLVIGVIAAFVRGHRARGRRSADLHRGDLDELDAHA